MRKWLIATLMFVLPGLLTGCLFPTDRELSRKLERALCNQYHPANATVTLHRSSVLSTRVKTLNISMSGFAVDTVPFAQRVKPVTVELTQTDPNHASQLVHQSDKKQRQQKVCIEKAKISLTNFSIMKLPIQAMEANLRNIEIPIESLRGGPFVTPAVKSCTGSFQMNEEELTTFIRTRNLPIDDVTVHLTREGCVLSGKAHALVDIPLELTGRLAIKAPATLYLDHPEIRVLSVAVPKAIVDKLIAGVNPIIDVNADYNLPVPVSLTRIVHEEKAIRIEGMAHFPQPEKR